MRMGMTSLLLNLYTVILREESNEATFRVFRLMRFSLMFFVFLCLYVCKFSRIFTPTTPPSPPLNNVYNTVYIFHQKKQFETNNYNIFQGIFLASVFLSLLLLSLLHLCNHVKYITFDTNLCTRRKVTTAKLPDCFWSFLSLIMLGLLFCECPDFPLIMFIIFINSSCGSVVNLILRFGKILHFINLYIFHSIYPCDLHSIPHDIPNLVPFTYKKCTTLVTNNSDFIVK